MRGRGEDDSRMGGMCLHPTGGQVRVTSPCFDVRAVARLRVQFIIDPAPPCRKDTIRPHKSHSMNVACSDLNCLHMISSSLQLNVFQSSQSPVSALGITLSVSVKSLLPGTIKGGLGLLNPACQNSNGPSGSSVIHLSSVNSWQLCPSIDYQLRGRRRGTTGRPFVRSPEGGLPAK